MKILFLGLLLGLSLCISVSEIQERDALMELYTATNGTWWFANDNWGAGLPCQNDWVGVQCDLTPAPSVVYLSLSSNNLTGTIPASLSVLKNLSILDLSANFLSGTLPSSFGDLKALNYLSVSMNFRLSGSIPEGLWELPLLSHLDVSFNSFSSALPVHIGDSVSLRVLNAQKNDIHGALPSGLASCTNLEVLDLGKNTLTGSIPVSFGLLKNLKVLRLSQNRLSGDIPPQITNLESLEVLSLSYNRFTGQLPEELFSLKKLRIIQLRANLIEGSVPSALGKMHQLEELDLSLNSLEGTLPSLQLYSLQSIDLSVCRFTGDLPNISHMMALEFCDFSGNRFVGSLPAEKPHLLRLRDLDISSNSIQGTLPSWIADIGTVSVYLVGNPIDCPYPPNLPSNVRVNSDCVSGWFYGGTFTIIVISLVVSGSLLVAVAVALSVYFGLRPSLLTVLTQADGREMDIDKLHDHSRALIRWKTVLYGLSMLTIFVALLVMVVGVSFFLSDEVLNPTWFICTIPPVSIFYVVKASFTIFGTVRNRQKSLLLSTSAQLMQAIFVVWSLQLTSPNSQSNQLSLFIMTLIVFDTCANLCASICAFYIHEHFIPVGLLQLDDKLIGAEGVFGEVRHGKYLGIDIAAKRSKPETKRERKRIFREFLREAHILSKLGNHPNIIHLIGISPVMKDEFYIIMEFCDDRDALTYLTKVHREEPPEVFVQSLLRICMGVCDAMAYIHRVGFTHRDLTASNILVKGGRPKIGDLGLAREITSNPRNDHLSTIPAFHSIYAPPELKEFPQAYTTGCDVYCFGTAIWEMVVLRKWARDDLLRPREEVLEDMRNAPAYFQNIVCRCWHEDDAFRPTFDELYTDFAAIYNQEYLSPYSSTEIPLCD